MKRSLICCNLLLKSLLNEHAMLLSNRLLMLLRLQWLCFPQIILVTLVCLEVAVLQDLDKFPPHFLKV